MTIDVFLSYAHEDKDLCEELLTWLRPQEHAGRINLWHDGMIIPGTEWEEAVRNRLSTAHLILLLISPPFMASKYCTSIEMTKALERHDARDARVIPVIIRPADWKEALFSKLQVLPEGGVPVTRWPNGRDDGFHNVTHGIRKAVHELEIQQGARAFEGWKIEHASLISLFGYETDGGTDSRLWKQPLTLSSKERYDEWWDMKRKVREEEIVNRTWVKVSNWGDYWIVRFDDKGDLKESLLSDPSQQWPGSWRFEDETLRITIGGSYVIDLFATCESRTFSGIEFLQGQRGTRGYFVFFPLQTNPTKHWDINVVPTLVDEIYKQVLDRRAQPKELIIYGSLLRRGEMSVRDVVKLLGLSAEYRQRFVDTQNAEKTIAQFYEHFLGRKADDGGRAHYTGKAKKTGFDAIIAELVDSPEYSENFGEDSAPQLAMRGLAAVSRWPNHLECFYRGKDHHLWHRYWYGPDSKWDEEGDMGGILTSAPAAISWGPDRIDCFYRGQNYQLCHRWYDGKAWNEERDLGGYLTSAPSVASLGPGHLDCYYRGQNNQLLHRWGDGSYWEPEDDLGGLLTSAPAVVGSGPDRIDCVIRGEDQRLWHRRWEKGSNWDEWKNVGGRILVSAPAITSWKANRFDCFFRGEDGHLWHRRCSGSTWGPEEDLGGDILTSTPATVSWGPDRIDCFYRGRSQHLWHKWWDGSKAGWSNFIDLGQISN